MVDLRGSAPRRLSCAAARGPPACPRPPSPPPPECDPSAASRTWCAPPPWDWNKSRAAVMKKFTEAECEIVVLTVVCLWLRWSKSVHLVFSNCYQSRQYRSCNSLFEEDVVLRAHPHGGADNVHVSLNVSSINVGRARRRREQAGQDGPGAEQYTIPSHRRCRLCAAIS